MNDDVTKSILDLIDIELQVFLTENEASLSGISELSVKDKALMSSAFYRGINVYTRIAAELSK